MIRASYATAHHDVVQKYVDSLVQGTAFAKKNKEMAVQTLLKYFKSEDTETMNDTYDYYIGGVVASLPYPEPDGFRDSVELLRSQGQPVDRVDLNKVLDRSFVQSAADRKLDAQ